MGLDMFLERIHQSAMQYLEYDPDEAKTKNLKIYEQMKPYILRSGDLPGIQRESLFEEVGYWRKANQIHNWFVTHVQNGEDDCGRYPVSEEQLKDLRALCSAVVTESGVKCEIIQNGYIINDIDAFTPIIRPGNVITNPEVAERLLPTTDGFFFGSTDYDEYYLQDIQETIGMLDTVLEETDFSVYSIYYTSSW